MSLKEFMNLFRFNQENTLKIGVERECHLLRQGRIVPIAKEVLTWLKNNVPESRKKCYGFELSACQLEDRLEKPSEITEVKKLLYKNENELRKAEKILGFKRGFFSAAPANMPLDHYPDPRYDRIVKDLSLEALKAACRVTGVHIHIGMPNHRVALLVYNKVVKHFEMLCRLGCISNSKRLELYEQVTNDFTDWFFSERIKLFLNCLVDVKKPPVYSSWSKFFERARKSGFEKDPRRCWDFIRISPHGTIEFRMFDTTQNIDQIVIWANICRAICELYIRELDF